MLAHVGLAAGDRDDAVGRDRVPDAGIEIGWRGERRIGAEQAGNGGIAEREAGGGGADQERAAAEIGGFAESGGFHVRIHVALRSVAGGRRAHFGGGAHDRLLDPRIGHAAAEIAVHMRDHFFLGGIGILGEQRSRLHDLAGLAVAALRNLLGDPCLLQRMIALGAEAFDGGDLLADGVADRGLAGSYGFAVDVNRAGAAQAGAAAEFRAGHLQLFADDPEQRRIVRRLDGHIPSVDIEIRHRSSPSGA